ncbi:MarR family winged helix-turn-helix transcriptional regulator [Rathayibacter sp. CAU 1779]
MPEAAASDSARVPTSGTRFAGGPAESPGFLLWRVTGAWQRAMASALAPLGLTHVQFVLLACAWWLGRDGVAPNQAQVAAQAGADVKMASEVFGRLEAKGLVTRRVDPHDSRAKAVEVTAEGRELAGRAVSVVEDADARFFASVDSAAAVTLLQRLAAGVGGA